MLSFLGEHDAFLHINCLVSLVLALNLNSTSPICSTICLFQNVLVIVYFLLQILLDIFHSIVV